MDPTIFLSGQGAGSGPADHTDPAAIDAFYERHGPNMFFYIARWRFCAANCWREHISRRNHPRGFAVKMQRG